MRLAHPAIKEARVGKTTHAQPEGMTPQPKSNTPLQVVAELTEAGLLGPDGMQVYVADTPFAPHGGVLSRWLDWLDLWREYAAIKYYQ